MKETSLDARGYLYGLAVALLAIIAGSIANLLFRK